MKKFAPKNFIIDVDGVLTDGKFYYSADGKVMKVFGPDDNDALHLIKDMLSIRMVSGDKRGCAITKRRIHDMGFPLDLVSTFERVAWIQKNFNLAETIYMGDGIFDSLVFDAVLYAIAPANAFIETKKSADFVTRACGGEGAVAEACFHIMKKFFTPLDVRAVRHHEQVGVWQKNKKSLYKNNAI